MPIGHLLDLRTNMAIAVGFFFLSGVAMQLVRKHYRTVATLGEPTCFPKYLYFQSFIIEQLEGITINDKIIELECTSAGIAKNKLQ